MRFLIFQGNQSGTAAVEFAIIAPVFLLVTLTLIAYAIYLSASSSLEQLAADLARTAIPGTTQIERRQLVDDYLQNSSLGGLLDRTRVSVDIETNPAHAASFTVTTSYDVERLPIWDLYAFPLPDHVIRRSISVTM